MTGFDGFKVGGAAHRRTLLIVRVAVEVLMHPHESVATHLGGCERRGGLEQEVVLAENQHLYAQRRWQVWREAPARATGPFRTHS